MALIPNVKALMCDKRTGIGLCLIALWLIGNTLYLNTVRDEKAEAVETLSQQMAEYESHLQHSRGKQHQSSLAPFLSPLHVGAFLNSALSALPEESIQIQEIRFSHVERSITDAETVSFPRAKSKAQPTNLGKQISIRGKLRQQTPYQTLDGIISQIEHTTKCQMTLRKASQMPETEQDAFSFELSLLLDESSSCQQAFQGKASSP